jgi:hypothetical protein
MDDRLGPTLAKALTGKRYDAGILAQAVENMPLDTNINDAAETRIIRQDIITLIKEKL